MSDVSEISESTNSSTLTETRPSLVRTDEVSGKMLLREVQPGLFATGYDLKYLDDVVLSHSVDSPAIYCGVLLSGEGQPMSVDGHGDVHFEQGKPFLLGVADQTHCESCYLAGDRCSFAGFMLQPGFFDRFSDTLSDEGIMSLQRLMEGGVSVMSCSYCPKLTELAHQALNHDYEGALSDLYLESCMLALVAEAGKLAMQCDEHEPALTLNRKQQERVRHAREVLDGSIASPPLMRDLSQRIGVNPTTLQMEFQQAYGTTVFGYVREQRLQLARAMLRTQDLAVSQIGYRVGFNNAAAFATAYRRRFGYPPSSEKKLPQ